MTSIKILAGLTGLLWVSVLNASTVTCGTEQRTASFESADYCVIGLQNPKVDDINDNYDSIGGWKNAGELTGDGYDQFLSATLTAGSWGSSSIKGNWQIDNSFWNVYDQAVISMHVGNGGGDPDYFSWLIMDNISMGSWSYDKLKGGGGGLSNFKLWGAGSEKVIPTVQVTQTSQNSSVVSVPEPTSIMLMGLGLIGIMRVRTKLTTR